VYETPAKPTDCNALLSPNFQDFLNSQRYARLAPPGFENNGINVKSQTLEKAVATCLRFATSNTFRKQFYGYLLPNGYVERVSRGVYKITEKGEKLLEILT